MARSYPSDWLYASYTGSTWGLLAGTGLQNIIGRLHDPDNQFPSLLLLVGSGKKSAARAAMFSCLSSPRSHALAAIDVEHGTTSQRYPLMIADLNTEQGFKGFSPAGRCLGQSRYTIKWSKSSATFAQDMLDCIIARLLITFTDVVCIFLDDFDSSHEAFAKLRTWSEVSRETLWHPHIIIVTYSPLEHAVPRKAHYTSLINPTYSKLLDSIMLWSKKIRDQRAQQNTLFNARHMEAFFEAALQHVAETDKTPFNFVRSMRTTNSQIHLREFFKLCSTVFITSEDVLLRYVASALLLDSSPPGTHRGLIVLMFYLRRNLKECISTFDELAREVFPDRRGLTALAKIRNLIASLLTDSLYGARAMETCVKKAYGKNTALFGHRKVSGTKFAVTTMTVFDPRLCILSNYNGAMDRRKDQGWSLGPKFTVAYPTGYFLYRPDVGEHEVLVCDAARATSAAPSYFPAKFISGLGYLQDGGAGKHNNPIDAAEWESRAIWDTSPDLAVSIGTGYARPSESPTTVTQRLSLKDRFLLRLFRLFNAIMSGEAIWYDHQNRIDENRLDRYFRINMPCEEQPELDDVSKIADIKTWSYDFFQTYDFRRITRALFASSFFFELRGKPVARRSYFQCTGELRCRSPNTVALLRRIVKEYPGSSFVFSEDDIALGPLEESDNPVFEAEKGLLWTLCIVMLSCSLAIFILVTVTALCHSR
ncbi:FabD/lysophospholipase-like protein [Aaosphaeria arxii CBS 175.79]|uniref:FabD/lysophospholipase-like protein n=1 Tax=Aaosphaeria arxii CBS 175.79 TaxID=1450172 RepID=A0A6A5X5W9_9PLEO|nr:FabD/lysophospholipase-like protein [Aaosphaeria arxii CBS 175.79]KAF2008339.1 FabD/lysophospholipase-like protein [Aaosphaeria arxii CBS 175.79]